VLRGPLVPLMFAAKSALAFASIDLLVEASDFARKIEGHTDQLSASLEMPCLRRPTLPWGLS
jgi:hypothetical protein